jgi:hypothetical protein
VGGIALALAFAISVFLAPYRQRLATQPVAYVEEVSGTVRVKPPLSHLWYDLKQGVYLKPGSSLYVHEASFADLHYFLDRVRVSYASEGFFMVNREAPRQPRFRKEFLGVAQTLGMDNAPSKDLDQKQARSFSRVLSHPMRESSRLVSDQIVGERGSLAIMREMRILPLKNVSSKIIYTVSDNFALFDVEAEEPFSQDLIYGYLWPESGGLPIWSGVARGRFSAVRLSPGNYVFQAVNDADSAISDPLSIVVRQAPPGALVSDAKLWPPEDWQEDEVHIYQ